MGSQRVGHHWATVPTHRHSSPAFAELRQAVVEWARRVLGLGCQASCALFIARGHPSWFATCTVYKALCSGPPAPLSFWMFLWPEGSFWLTSWRNRVLCGIRSLHLHNQISCDSLHNPASMYNSRRQIRLCFSIGISNSLHYVRRETAELSSKLLSLTVMERKLL